jgi:hydrogenase nickel incorporation protein HypB
MDKVRFIDIKETILSDNRDLAEQIRADLRQNGVFMLNIMASPGAGKTSLILEALRRMKKNYRFAVIEGDIESQVDSDKVAAEEVEAVQLRTGGSCHLDAPMVKEALGTLNLAEIDAVFIENIGNLVCPAEFDLGETRKVMILSVPEGDDKVIKYPLMFSVCDLLVVSKIDYLQGSDFNMQSLTENARKLNPKMKIIQTSCKTEEGLDDWCSWLKAEIDAAAGRR